MKKEKYHDMATAAYHDYAAKQAGNPVNLTEQDENAVSLALVSLSDDQRKAVEAVYMYAPAEPLTSNKIGCRAKRHALESCWSVPSVWRMLSEACRVYAEFRGLI